ncbi:MAG: hypothetical protein EOP61_06990 [Sphingomonadales bacterium]|nr:MAG: hypothetical protein EOP61_06990 [Sphingomonadales bacterium]
MAYVNFAEIQGGADGAIGVYGEAPPAHRTGFTALEWQVIALAQRDSLSTLHAPSKLSIAMDAVFGMKRINPELANPSLEVLRRISVLAWHRGFALPQSQVEAFHAAGYSEDQLETLLGSIGAGRLAAKRKAFS